MALLGKLSVPVIADTSRFSSGLASSANMADAWAGRIEGKVDSAFAGFSQAHKRVGGLASALDRVSRATEITRAALAFGDVGRVAGRAAVGVGRLRLAFMGSSDKATALRSRLDATTATLDKMASASQKVRWGLLGADLGVMAVKLGALGGGFVGKAAGALGSIAVSGVKVTSSLIRAGTAAAAFAGNTYVAATAVGSMVVNLAKAGAAFGAYGLSLGRWGAAGKLGFRSLGQAAVSLFTALHSGRRAIAWLPSMSMGLGGILRGALGATGGVLRLGRSLVGIGWASAIGLARGFESALGGVTRAAASVALGLGKVATVGAAAAAVFGVKAAVSAAKLSEVVNKTKEVFGEYADTVLKAADATNTAYGTKQREFMDSAAALGGLLQGAGYTTSDSAKLSVNLARLAKDMENFREIPFEEALAKIRSGLAGEAMPLKSIGVLIDDATVKAYAWTHGLAENGKELTQSQKVQARLALITQGLSKDQGALARESSGTAAQVNEFNGRLRTLVDTIGATLSPVLGAALMEINTLIAVMVEAWKDSESSILDWFGVTAESVGGAAEGIGFLQASIGWLADAWSLVKGAAATAFSYIEAGLSKLATVIAKVLRALEWAGAFGMESTWGTQTAEFLEGYSDAAKQVSDDLWDYSQEAFDGKNLGSDKINAYFARVRKQIEEARGKMAENLDFSAADPKGLEAPKKDDSKDRNPFAGAYEMGSKGAAEIIARHTFGGENASEKHAKATAENTAKLLSAARDLNQALLGGPRVAVMGLS